MCKLNSRIFFVREDFPFFDSAFLYLMRFCIPLRNNLFSPKMMFDISDFGRTEAAREWELVVIPIDKKIISQVDTPVVPFESVINRSYPPIDIQIVSILRSPQK